MRYAWMATCGALLCLAGQSRAAELEKIERVIGKLPAFTAKAQQYCLLVFGSESRKQVWLVHDGAVLYVDRNGNGDLTDPEDRVAADPQSNDDAEGVFAFSAGDIPDAHGVHKDLNVSWFSLEHLRETDEDIRNILADDPDFRACSVSIDVDMPKQRGGGIDGRVPQSASAWDHRGMLAFASRPAEAPIIHFGGPWEVTLAGFAEKWRVGRTEKVYLVVGTPGMGPGTTADVSYDKVIPAALAPKLQVSFPPASAGQPAVVTSYELAERCCSVNLYGDVAVPKDAGTGKAQVLISLESWPGVFIAPSQHDVEIVPPKPGPKLEPVSPRLLGKLQHENPKGTISGIRFSPDGKRLIAGDYPGGIIHLWDVANGQRLSRMNAGEELRASTDYFMPSPDWQTVYAWQEGRGRFQRFEREGKIVTSVAYDSVIRSWNLESGRLLQTFQHNPARGIRMMYLAPNGKYFLTIDEVPGEIESGRPRALSLWDTATGESRQVERGSATPGAISSDSRLVAVSMPTPDDDSYNKSIKIFAAPQWQETCNIPLSGPLMTGNTQTFAAGDRILVGDVRILEKRDDWSDFREFLKFWDVDSGAEILSIPAPEKRHGFAYQVASPDGQTVVSTTYSPGRQTQENLVIVNVREKSWKLIDFAPGAVSGEPVFHPDGKYLAIPTQVRSDDDDDSPEDIEQPRIVLISVPDGEIMETLVSPPAHLPSLAFNPAGTTLATSGHGEVLLWDFHTTPARATSGKQSQ